MERVGPERKLRPSPEGPLPGTSGSTLSDRAGTPLSLATGATLSLTHVLALATPATEVGAWSVGAKEERAL